jgi:hypothetical protein
MAPFRCSLKLALPEKTSSSFPFHILAVKKILTSFRQLPLKSSWSTAHLKQQQLIIPTSFPSWSSLAGSLTVPMQQVPGNFMGIRRFILRLDVRQPVAPGKVVQNKMANTQWVYLIYDYRQFHRPTRRSGVPACPRKTTRNSETSEFLPTQAAGQGKTRRSEQRNGAIMESVSPVPPIRTKQSRAGFSPENNHGNQEIK